MFMDGDNYMKKLAKEVQGYFLNMHPLPFWIFAAMLLLSAICNVASSVIVHNPSLLGCPADASSISSDLFQLGLGLSAIGFIVAPFVDIIVKYDFQK